MPVPLDDSARVMPRWKHLIVRSFGAPASASALPRFARGPITSRVRPHHVPQQERGLAHALVAAPRLQHAREVLRRVEMERVRQRLAVELLRRGPPLSRHTLARLTRQSTCPWQRQPVGFLVAC